MECMLLRLLAVENGEDKAKRHPKIIQRKKAKAPSWKFLQTKTTETKRMITPVFSISQDDEYIIVVIKCPYVKAQNVEFYSEANEFKFYVKPYFLRLTFPSDCTLVEDGRERAFYNIDAGEITCHLPKAVKGQHFTDLDMLTKLMAPRKTEGATAGGSETTGTAAGAAVPRPLIEVVGETPTGQEEVADSDDEDEDFDWELEQELQQPELSTGTRLGFNNAHTSYGSQITQIARDVLDIDDIDASTPACRREERIAKEDAKFDEDHYMADFVNDEEIQRVIKYRPESWAALKRIQKAKGSSSLGAANPPSATNDATSMPDMSSLTLSEADPLVDPWLDFSAREQEQMRSLPNKECTCGHSEDLRKATANEARMSPDLLDDERGTYLGLTFSSLRQCLIASVRRSLAFPLYRNFALSLRVVEDVAVLFKLGRRSILKALLEVRDVLGGDEGGYALRRLWIDDYCVWIQHASDKTIRSLASELNHIKIAKADIGWPLEELEQIARECADEEAETDGGEVGQEVRMEVTRDI
ncbi:Hsp90 cochaperone shq1 [Borealophlyctis nickersoniae]|nr:Hsp90 cochaperone shq1 [Borealophlyctis nickersoniae]